MRSLSKSMTLSAFFLACGLNSAAYAAIAVVGPDSDVVSYELADGIVHIRVCQPNSTLEEIESASRCALAEGQSSEIAVNLKDFKDIEVNGLGFIKKDKLSASDQDLLRKSTTDVSSLEEKQKEVEKLKAEVDRLAKFKEEYPHDYKVDAYQAAVRDATTKMMQSQADLSHVEAVVAAKVQTGAIFDKINQEMEGQAVSAHQLMASESGRTIAFRFLKDLAMLPNCSSEGVGRGVCKNVIDGHLQIVSPVRSGAFVPGPMGMAFVRLAPATFEMGSPVSEAGRSADEVLHQVMLSKSFEIQVNVVTQAQFVQITGANPSKFQARENCPTSFTAIHGVQLCPHHPVENVSFDDVQRVISYFNSISQDGYRYRLPTEAEWEYAARAGTTTAYSFGNDPSQLGNFEWYKDNSGNQTHDVGTRKSNPFGLFDMQGNVYQWIEDLYCPYPTSAVTDPLCTSSSRLRDIRGGAWNGTAVSARIGGRGDLDSGSAANNTGFRLVRTR